MKLCSFLDTSRPPRVLEENGQTYWFTDRETMEEEIKQHRFLEYGEYNEHLYGTHLDSIRDVIRQVGRLEILFFNIGFMCLFIFRAKCVYWIAVQLP